MRIIAVGIDIVEIDRIREAYRRYADRFAHRIYSEAERARIARLVDPAPYLAGRWAVKEAVMKVLGTGLSRGVTFRDIQVIREPSGAPTVKLSGVAQEIAHSLGIGQIMVSITHGRDLAAAHAMGVDGNGDGGLRKPDSASLDKAPEHS